VFVAGEIDPTLIVPPLDWAFVRPAAEVAGTTAITAANATNAHSKLRTRFTLSPHGLDDLVADTYRGATVSVVDQT
jgi:hypothetical protein